MRGGSRSNHNTDLPHAPKQPGRNSGVLSALAADDLGVNLICAGVEQPDSLVFELPHVTIET